MNKQFKNLSKTFENIKIMLTVTVDFNDTEVHRTNGEIISPAPTFSQSSLAATTKNSGTTLWLLNESGHTHRVQELATSYICVLTTVT